jgi:hypothetical protein
MKINFKERYFIIYLYEQTDFFINSKTGWKNDNDELNLSKSSSIDE